MQRLRFWFRLWLLAGLACLAGQSRAHVVCVVSSDMSAAFQQVSDGLVRELVRNGIARHDILLIGAAEYPDGGPHTQDNRLTISLGSEAFRQVTARNTHSAVIAGLIPRLSYERILQEASRKNSPPVAALYIDQPFGRQLDLLHLALPAAHRVGVLWGAESVSQQALLANAVQSRGLELSEGVFADGQTLIGALRAALRDADVLLAVADSTVYNPSSVSNILLTSYRGKTPVLAFSPAYVKAGALLSVHSTAAQAGAQIAAMSSAFLQSGNLPASQYPSEFSISVNAYVAHSLGLSLDADLLTERLRKLEKKP